MKLPVHPPQINTPIMDVKLFQLSHPLTLSQVFTGIVRHVWLVCVGPGLKSSGKEELLRKKIANKESIDRKSVV
jgi:hypothetical protein